MVHTNKLTRKCGICDKIGTTYLPACPWCGKLFVKGDINEKKRIR